MNKIMIRDGSKDPSFFYNIIFLANEENMNIPLRKEVFPLGFAKLW